MSTTAEVAAVVIAVAPLESGAIVTVHPLPAGRGSGHSDQMRSANTGVEVLTVAIANRCSPALALLFAIAGTPHSYAVGGNSSHGDPVVCGTSHSARIAPTVGAVV